ncbi:transposase [Microbulbifer sp. JMSA004]|uniref:transposase n=1 Tax=Microbulbifer sp. JMSA004 TaxID=3243370 RepID=UPI0040398F23
MFPYSKGITSGREIQRQSENNTFFKALLCDTVPHFTSVTNFVSSYPDVIDSVFEQVLLVCDQQGLLGNELFTIDRYKMPSNASKEHSGTSKELKKKQEKFARRSNIASKRFDGRKPKE